MSRVCELSGKSPMSGNNVSHANNKTKRRFLPNLVQTTLMSEALGQAYSFRVATSTIRSVEHMGGLDPYLLKTKDDKLSQRARRVKRNVEKKQAAA